MTKLIVACVAIAGLVSTAAGAANQKPAEDVTVAPVVIKEVKPDFPKAAMKEGKQGAVWISVRVEPDGTVGAAKIIKPLSPKLDAEAIKAAKQWRFKPGTKNGKAVAVDTQLEMTFTLR